MKNDTGTRPEIFAKVMRDQTDMKQALDAVTRLNAELRKTIQRLNGAQETLDDKVRDLEKFEETVVGRELEMIKIKRHLKDAEREIERLKGSAHSRVELGNKDAE